MPVMSGPVDIEGTDEPADALYRELRGAVAATMEHLDQLSRHWDELSDADRRALAAAAADPARRAVDTLLPVLVELVSSRRRS